MCVCVSSLPPTPIQGPELSQLVQSYNRTAVVLMEYEVLHLQAWSRAAEGAPHRLSAALLVRHPSTKVWT